jgi:predicted  nucleic acid-binding Zn-ribbon protein
MSQDASSIQPMLQKLANLQYIDSRIDEIKQLQGDLPDEILDIETEIARQEGKVQRLKDELNELDAEKRSLELEIESSTEKMAKYEEQQLAVRNNREYDALTKEIENKKVVIQESHERIEAIALRVEEANEELAAAEAQLSKEQERYEEKKSNLDRVVDLTRKEGDVLEEKRVELEKEVDERYLRSYNRLRNGLNNGIAVVAMKDGAALGMALPPQKQVEVRKKTKVVIDENSGRMVIDQSFFDEARKTFNL